MRLNARGLLTLLPLAILPPAHLGTVASAPRLARPASDGWVVTERLMSDDPAAQQMGAVTMRIKVADGHLRLEMESAAMAQMGPMFMLLRDSGKVVLVMASQGMALSTDINKLAAMQGSMGLAQPQISDPSASIEDLGAGDKMQGFATRKYRMHTTYTQTTGADVSKVDATIDMWMATDMPGLADGLQKYTESFASSFSGFAGGSSKDLTNAYKSKMPKGFAMKMVVVSKTTGGAAPKTSTSTIEVTDVAKTSIEASEFEVPAGIQVMDLAQMTGGRGGH